MAKRSLKDVTTKSTLSLKKKEGSGVKKRKNEIKKPVKLVKSKPKAKGSTKSTVKDEKSDIELNWDVNKSLAESENLKLTVADNIIKLLDEESTVPFIARYRSNLTEGLSPDQLRNVKSTYEYLLKVQAKAKDMIKKISTKGNISPDLKLSIQNARSLEELEFIEAPFKTNNKRSLAEKAKELGLEEPANHILYGDIIIHLENYVDSTRDGLKNVKDVRLGIQHIVANAFNKDPDVLQHLKKIQSSREIKLQSKFATKSQEGVTKYDLYGDFCQSVKTIKPHQTLAINRGETEKVLSVKLVIPDHLWNFLKAFIMAKTSTGEVYYLRRSLIEDSLNDAIKRFFAPFLARQIRALLKKEAEKEAVNLFAGNLRQLLLVAPCPETVMAIDPGFKHGCKVAVVSSTGEPLALTRIYLKDEWRAKNEIASLANKYDCKTIALGDGCGSRETEVLLSDLIREKKFKHSVSYSVVSEQGVSIYSCSPIAAEEFPTLEPVFLSAVSLARRLQNPLSELVKVEPKHLGVGMYQHDINKKKLESALDEIVSECVSFIGVDVNSASLYLLRRVAGLSEDKAKEIIKYRTECCTFRTREDLKKVKGIKEKTFKQCAGFIRIVPSTASCERHFHSENELNPLDETSIHPESYSVVEKIIFGFGLNLNDLGTPDFCNKVKCLTQFVPVEDLAKNLDCSEISISFIINRLTKPRDFDQKSLSRGPVFLKGVKTFEELVVGQRLQGLVKNVVPFGAFVDIGVRENGLMHNKTIRNISLQINDRVNVEIEALDPVQRRISLKFISVITD